MENKFLMKHNKKDCNGCGICTQICPKNAIKMEEDEEGFFYPVIDTEKCIKCNKCLKICSNFNNSTNSSDAYMAINKDKKELEKSSSGGMYYLLAKEIISRSGVVFGVKYDEKLKPYHSYAETLSGCQEFQGSKYLRSNLKDSFQNVKKFLDEERYVLFTGTPCQCDALKVFLKKEYEKLITCEIICHSNPSYKVFNKYIKTLEDNRNKEIIDVKFRTKKNGWKNQTPLIIYKDGTDEFENSYYRAFASGLLGRPSCYDCKFVTLNRVSDFTIGDLWGNKKILPDFEDKDTGMSLLLVNTDKGRNLFDFIKDDIIYEKIDINEAFKYNHNKNVPMNKNRNKFFKEMNDGKNVIYLMNKYSKDPLGLTIKIKLKKIIKKVLKKR